MSFGSSQGKGAPEAIDAFTVADIAEASVAGGEDDELGTKQVELGSLEGGEATDFIAAAAGVEPSQSQSRTQQGIFDGDAQRP